MKKQLLLLVLVNFLIISLVSAQEKEPKSADNTKSGFYTGFYITPSYIGPPSYRYYYVGTPGDGGNVLIIGIQAGYTLNSRIAFQTGFEYANETINTANHIHRFNFPEVSSPGNYYQAIYDINYFQVPLLIKTYLSGRQKKLRWYMPLGAVYRLQQAEEKLTEYSSEGFIVNNQNTTKSEHAWYLNIGIGCQYKLNDKFTLFAEPFLRKSLWRKDAGEQWRRYYRNGTGINIGANYHF